MWQCSRRLGQKILRPTDKIEHSAQSVIKDRIFVIDVNLEIQNEELTL